MIAYAGALLGTVGVVLLALTGYAGDLWFVLGAGWLLSLALSVVQIERAWERRNAALLEMARQLGL